MTIRKVFGCCALVSAVVAVGTSLAVVHARRHPDSPLGRTAIAAYRTAVGSNPLCLLTHAGEGQGCCCECVAVTADGKNEAPSLEEVPDPTLYRLPGRIVLREEPEFRPVGFINDFNVPPPSEVALELIPPPKVVEEEEFGAEIGIQSPGSYRRVPSIMPPAVDDPAPAIMPRADDAGPDSDFISFWKQFLGGPVLLLDCCREENGEFRNYGLPPDCQEMRYYHLLYPAFPYSCPESRYYCPYTGQRIEHYAPSGDPSDAVRYRIDFRHADENGHPLGHPDVDTMEFRPGEDARPKELGGIRF